MENTTRPASRLKRYIGLCPVRLCIFAVCLLLLGVYYALRQNKAFANVVVSGFTRPWHSLAGTVSGWFPFSLAEVLYVLAVVGVLFFIGYRTVHIIRSDKRGEQILSAIVSLLTALALFWTGSCYLWGIYYYGDGFQDKSGLTAAPVEKGELMVTTLWFAHLADTYAREVRRDDAGQFAEDQTRMFDHAVHLYDKAAEKYPFLAAKPMRAKAIRFSRVMSHMNFTGFFFPLTGEANLNVDAPQFLLPATIAHEIAHQRGVAPEQEANFVAVMTCLEDGDPVFVYSAAALAYIYLGNALYDADYDLWHEIYSQLSEPFLTDLRANNEYWDQFDTKAAEISETIYTEFLESNGQTLGMQSYGACVDLLVAYYYDTAAAWLTQTSEATGG